MGWEMALTLPLWKMACDTHTPPTCRPRFQADAALPLAEEKMPSFPGTASEGS